MPSLFNQMERAGLTPDLWTYNSLASVLGSCGEWERAVALLDDMRARGLRPDVITYSALVSACEKAGQVSGSACVDVFFWGGGQTRNYLSAVLIFVLVDDTCSERDRLTPDFF